MVRIVGNGFVDHAGINDGSPRRTRRIVNVARRGALIIWQDYLI
jgi:hypothetical protein